ncbi:GNAT family protein [Sulfitobacter sp. F26204]|uniref:GNAT family N-acetyltransferase n=1 Tax=Sulfitobacter sp. F26204 TaxID=2996014 RepID=UPI00225DEF2A|nr:GNAT family protein [Sulfitobacter sp. F26204]MCX7557930.1 GNAT family protein [Sulfitobacter sp. F26204]
MRKTRHKTVITTKRLVLRPMQARDRDDLFAVFGNTEVMAYWSTLPHATAEETAQLIEQTLAADRETTAEFAIEYAGRVIGKAGFWQMPEIGYLLHRDYWRRGIGYEALEALIVYGFDQRGLSQITADVDPDNIASVKLLTKLGFVETDRAAKTFQIGGKWCDSIYFALQRDSWQQAKAT